MAKSADAFRTISEVADWLGVPTHVLRFWESKFPQVKPLKRAGGRRYYRPADMALLAGIRVLLHDDGITIRGVQKILREQGVKHVASLCDRALSGEAEVEAPDTENVVLEVAEAEENTVVDVADRFSAKPEQTPDPEPEAEEDAPLPLFAPRTEADTESDADASVAQPLRAAEPSAEADRPAPFPSPFSEPEVDQSQAAERPALPGASPIQTTAAREQLTALRHDPSLLQDLPTEKRDAVRDRLQALQERLKQTDPQ